MTKRRYPVPGGKFPTYEEARAFRDAIIMDAWNPDEAKAELQIRKTEKGFQVVVRKEVGK